ncbi:cysteine synthase A [compost metagenome]
MGNLAFAAEVTDPGMLERAAASLRKAGVGLPTLSQLANPHGIPEIQRALLAEIGPDQMHPANLWRVHWYNDELRRELAPVPCYVELPREITGVEARIVVAIGHRFPMIRAHKVLAAYGCLVQRLVTGRFDPSRHRAVWPSTGNYCRGGVAISRILGCRGIAVLPEGMSRERFDWLERWVADATDIVRTPGTESNVKEIYDECALLAREDDTVVLNQFSEFGNYLAHYTCTGEAMSRIYTSLREASPGLRLNAFVSATGSAGTLAAGDLLKARHGARIAAVEALECPTMLSNGYGEHNIQGIGDKHIPLIHNVMNTDVVIGVSDDSCDALNLLFNSATGASYLHERQYLDPDLLDALTGVGISGWANIIGAIKLARHYRLGADDLVLTVATDSAAMYDSERSSYGRRAYPNGFDVVRAAEAFGRNLQGIASDHVQELTYADRSRIFNLGYYTWVEQQGVPLGEFESRRDQSFWTALQASVSAWDRLIDAFNERTGVMST